MRVRRQVLERDGCRCTQCGRPGRLEVHHIIRVADGGAPFDPDNLRTVCVPCHLRIHGGRGRSLRSAGQTDPERIAWRRWLSSR